MFKALLYRQLPQQFAPVVISFDKFWPVGSNGNVPANGVVFGGVEGGGEIENMLNDYLNHSLMKADDTDEFRSARRNADFKK